LAAPEAALLVLDLDLLHRPVDLERYARDPGEERRGNHQAIFDQSSRAGFWS
jgi:hypothetical protein